MDHVDQQKTSKVPVTWYSINLDLLKVIFALYHGGHHFKKAPFGKIFLSHFFQASKSRKS